MRHYSALLWIVIVSACAQQPDVAAMRIDGTSTESFERSYKAMLDALPGPEKVRLVLAMDRRTTGTINGKIVHIPTESLRVLLHGKTFDELVKILDEPDRKFKVEFITEPSNNALERERGQ